MIAGKQMDLVMGVDIHIVNIPSPAGPVPTPLPHPHIGMLMDPMEFLPLVGNTVWVNNKPGAYAGAAGMTAPPHIPLGAGFVKPIDNENELFMGSATVLLAGQPMSSLGHMALSCSCVGAPPPPRPGKDPGAGMFLPTSTFLVIPGGQLVMVGGPPTIVMMGLFMSWAKVGFGWMKKTKAMKKASKKVHQAAAKATKKLPKNARNKIHRSICDVTGHPVDIPTGKVFTDQVDFELNGPIPIVWERTWFSTSDEHGPVGHGWHHSYDMWMQFSEADNAVQMRLNDGRNFYFPPLEDGETHFNLQEKLLVQRIEEKYVVRTSDRLFYHFDAPNFGDTDKNPIQKVSNKTGLEVRFSYDNFGALEKITDAGGKIITFENDSKNRIKAICLPHPLQKGEYQKVVGYRYDTAGNLVDVEDAFNKAMRFEYQNHLLVKETDKNGLCFEFEYDGIDAHAKCIRTWGSNGIYDHKLTYIQEKRLTIVENSLGHQTFHYWNDTGLVFKEVNPLGRERITRYGEATEVLSQTDAAGQSTFYVYNQENEVIHTTFPDGTQLMLAYQDGLPIGMKDQNGGTWVWSYDEYDRLVQRMNPNGAIVSYNYEGHHLKEIINPKGAKSTLGYDQSNNLVAFVEETTGAKSTWQYDKRGRIDTAIDPLGNAEQYQYDRKDQLIKHTSADGNVRRFDHDAEGNVISIQDRQYDIKMKYTGMNKLAYREQGGTAIHFHYDTEENLKEIVNEAGENYSFEINKAEEVIKEKAFDGMAREFERDVLGRVIETYLPNGKTVGYEYDKMDRILRVNYEDSWEAFDYRADGAIIGAENPHIKLNFERDAVGRIITEQQGGFELTSSWDLMGNRIGLKSSLGEQIEYKRNAIGDIQEVIAGNGNMPWNTNYQRDILGQEIERLMPGNVKNSWKRDRLGRPVSHETSAGGKLARRRKYVWGMNFRLKEIIDEHKGAFKYQHDDLGNLIGVEKPNGEVDYRTSDVIGNLFKTEKRTDRTYGPGGRLLEANGTKYDYDHLGNLKSKITRSGEVWEYEWNDIGHLKKVIRPDDKEVSFTYDALGRRIAKHFGGKTTRWVWDGNFILHEWVETNKYSNTNSSGSEENLISIDPTKEEKVVGNKSTWVFDTQSYAPIALLKKNESFSIVSDHLGTPCAMYDQQGDEVWKMDLNIFGKIDDLKGHKEACPFRYPGQYEDEETGLYYNRFRYYAPDEGLYISQDPIGLSGGLSLYSYVADTTSAFDPFGLIIVYRALNGGQEASALAGEDIQPKDINATYSVQEHIDDGSLETQYISTTKKKKTAEFYAKPKPSRGKHNASTIIAIETDLIDESNLLDVSSGTNPKTGDALELPAFKYAKKDKEVLIKGAIPANSYTIVKKKPCGVDVK